MTAIETYDSICPNRKLDVRFREIDLVDEQGQRTKAQSKIGHIVCPECQRGYIAHVRRDTLALRLPAKCKRCKKEYNLSIDPDDFE